MLLFANNAESTLKVGALATDTQLILADGTGARFPNPGDGESFFTTLVDLLGNVEIVEVTARAGDVFTEVIRARDGTTAKAFPMGAVVDHRVTAEVLRRISPESLLGQNNGIAPLDADGRIPDAYLPVSVLTQALADARYIQLSQINLANGVAGLDATGKVAMAQLPASLVTTAVANDTYVKVSQINAADGVAGLDADGKLPATIIKTENIDLTAYAKVVDPNFTNNITVGNQINTDKLSVTGAATVGSLTTGAVAASGAVTIKGGSPIGKRTLSTAPPSGVPAAGDEWIQHAA